MEDIHTLCCQRFMQTPATVDSSGPLGEKASTAKRAFVASPNHRPCLDHFPYLISISSHLFPRAKNAKKDLEGKASLEVWGIRAEQGWTYKRHCLGAWEGTANTNPVFQASFPGSYTANIPLLKSSLRRQLSTSANPEPA
ncbi:hypothetical protein CIHG_01902 [Coccidioides immitis H538.4]|uniref:Uncharacterized protein n=1 Tax=Coccidioides immitis H538.4 TaxID=396776 RepID=A0A0J8RHM1_COCIT|nr:hypothetical protein CIHG_01902 [Coccidioides immitis H538.4]